MTDKEIMNVIKNSYRVNLRDFNELPTLDEYNKSFYDEPTIYAEWDQEGSHVSKLALDSINIAEIQDEILKFKKCNELRFYTCLINYKELLPKLAKSKQLISLVVVDDGILELPGEIGELKQLTSLQIVGNGIQMLPKEICTLKKLTSLIIRGNGIQALPKEIGELKQLTSLVIRGNGIKKLPKEIGKLKQLTSLEIIGNAIAELPEEISELKLLTSLEIIGDAITELLKGIDKLELLESLDIRLTGITELPKEIGRLKLLKSLDIRLTGISELPKEIGELKQLEILDISGTGISELPKEIGELKRLQRIDISDLMLRMIPKSLVDMDFDFINVPYTKSIEHNKVIVMHNTKLKRIDISLFEQPKEVIKAFYDGNLQVINECKVIFLGDGDVGKSSLIERILHNRYKEKSLPTNGIKITPWETHIDDTPVKIRCWDFGGQEIMHSMHKCFLTSRTVYIIVLDARQDKHFGLIAKNWLESVNSFAPNCSVLLVINKTDLVESASIDENTLKTQYPSLKRVIKTSAENGKGIDELKRVLLQEVSQSAGYTYFLNEKWLWIKNELETMEVPYIEKEEYIDLCYRAGVKEVYLQQAILDWFKDLGISYYYKSERFDAGMERIRVLRPEWLTNGIYRLILCVQSQNGILEHENIRSILNTKNEKSILPELVYNETEVDFILNVMRQFGISHDLGKKEFIPLTCTQNSPDTVNMFDKSSALHLSFESDYFPNNVIHRLMIGLYNDIDENCLWRNGARFNDYENNYSALVYFDEKSIDIFVTAKEKYSKQTYLRTIRTRLLKILDEMNLKYEEYLHYQIKGISGKEPYERIFQSYLNGIDKIYLSDTKTVTSPQKLLHELYLDQWLVDERNKTRKNTGNTINNIKITNTGNISGTTIGQGSTLHQKNNGTVNSEKYIEALLSKEAVRDDQLQEILNMLQNILKTKHMQATDANKLQESVSSIKSSLDSKSAWEIVREYLGDASNFATVAAAAAPFIVPMAHTFGEWLQLVLR